MLDDALPLLTTEKRMSKSKMGTVPVTAEDIQQHVSGDAYRCMLSRALARATGMPWWVTYEGAKLMAPGRKGYIRFGKKVGDLLSGRDSGHETAPFTVHVAASWLKPAGEVSDVP